MPNPVKSVESEPAPARPRGRPRSMVAHAAILQAARELIAQFGPSGVTMDALAARAGVGKPTIYRWWPDRHAVAMAALMDAPLPPAARSARPRSLQAALTQQMLAMVEAFSSANGRNLASMVAAADPHTELSKAFRNHFVLARREEGLALLQAAVQRGELRADLELEVTLDLLYGPLFFRLLLGHAPLDAAFVKQLLAQLLPGLR